MFSAVLGISVPVMLPAAQTPTERVWIRGLDLATPKGQLEFQRRLEVAVERLCAGPASRLPSHTARRSIEACKGNAREVALQQLEVRGIQVARTARRD